MQGPDLTKMTDSRRFEYENLKQMLTGMQWLEDLDGALAGRWEPEDAGRLLYVDDEYRGAVVLLFYLAGARGEFYRSLLHSAWGHNHREVMRAARTRGRLKSMFRCAKFSMPAELPDPVVIWRGTSLLPIRLAAKGLSWTISREVACFFALRFAAKNGHPLVLRAVVPRSEVLLYSNERSEEEVVCFSPGIVTEDEMKEEWEAECARFQAKKEASFQAILRQSSSNG